MITRSKRYVIVGDGAAGMSAARALRVADGQARIQIVSDDPNPAYFRAALTNYLLGELREEQIWATRPEFYDAYRIERVHARCTGLEANRGKLHLGYGAPLDFDALLIASGSRSRLPTWSGSGLYGVMTLRTLQDTRTIMERIGSGQVERATVLGGGPLALEWALGMHARGISVSLVLRGSAFMAGTLDAVASDLLAARLRQAGIQLLTNDEIVAAMPSADGKVGAIATRSGRQLPCQLVAAAIGVIPNTEWLTSSGVALSARGGVKVNDRMQTSFDNVFAAGDVIEWPSVAQLWEPARAQAGVAAANMLGQVSRYAPGVHYMATRLFDLDCASLGKVADVANAEELRDLPTGTGRLNYRKLVLVGGRLVGALMLGHREDRVRARGRWWKRLIDSELDVSSVKGRLLDPSFDLAAWYARAVGQVPKPLAAPVSTAGPQVGSGAELRGTRALELTNLLSLGASRKAATASTSRPPLSTGASSTRAFAGATTALGELIASGTSALDSPLGNATASEAFGTRVLAQFNLRPSPKLQTSIALQARPAALDWAGQRFALEGSLCRIGRAEDSEVRLSDPSVSLVHAHLQFAAGSWYLRDLGTQSGTWVNGAPLTVSRRIESGDRIRVGQCELAFLYLDEQPHGMASALPSGPPAPRLEVRSGHGLGLAFQLSGQPLVIGRDPARAALCLDEPSWAGEHARLLPSNQGWKITRVHPDAELWVNRVAVPSGQLALLSEGAELHLGRVGLRYTETPIPHQQVDSQRIPSQQVPSQQVPSQQVPSQAVPGGAASRAIPERRTSEAAVHSGRKLQAFAAVDPELTRPGAVHPTQQVVSVRASSVDAATAAQAGTDATRAFSLTPTFVVVSGPERGKRVALADQLVVGSQAGCSWLIADPQLAPQQLELRTSAGVVFARNLGPPGSLSIDGNDPGTSVVRLTPGAQLRLGPNTSLILEGSTP